MPYKKTLIGIDARAKIEEGSDFYADALELTLGKFGQNFLLEKGNKVTNDGKLIGAEIEHEDEHCQRAIQFLRACSINTEAEVQDASTTSPLLARKILHEALKFMPKSKAVPIGKLAPVEIINTIQKERLLVEDMLDGMMTPVESREQLIASAKVSVEDDHLAELIGGMQWDLGPEGIIIAEETLATTSSIEKVSGIRIDNGSASPAIVNNFKDQSLEVSNTRVILTNHVIKDITVFAGLFVQLAAMGSRSVTLVARAFSEEAIQQCLDNTASGFGVFAVNAPYVNQREIFLDLAAVLGGNYLDLEERTLDSIQVADVGFAERIVVGRNSATFAGKTEDNIHNVNLRITQLEEVLKGNLSTFERRAINERLGQLRSGFAIVSIGAESEGERKRLKDKADDCVGSVRWALQSGTVPGAGLAYLKASEQLPEGSILKLPLRCINDRIMLTAPKDFKVEDWVRDPLKTMKVALKYACQAAADLATAGGVITTKKDKPRLVEEVAKQQ